MELVRPQYEPPPADVCACGLCFLPVAMVCSSDGGQGPIRESQRPTSCTPEAGMVKLCNL